MVTIPQQLRPPIAPKIQKPLTLAQVKQARQPQTPTQVTEVNIINEELESFSTNLTYENYQTKYNALSNEAKQYATPPEQIFQSPEYQSYQSQIQSYQSQIQSYNEYEQGRSLARRGKFPFGATPSMRQGYDDEINKIQAFDVRVKLRQDIKEVEKIETKLFQGPVQPGVSEKVFRETGETQMLFQGPVQPGVSEPTFRETGVSQRLFQGPVRLGYDEPTFRETGEEKFVGAFNLGGDRETPSVAYLGGEEIRFVPRPPLDETISTQPTSALSIGAITPDYSRGIRRRVEEYIPIAGIPITAMREDVYLSSSADFEKFNKLIADWKPGAGKRLTDFLRKQQAKFKRDIGRYNQLNIIFQNRDLTIEEKEERRLLEFKLNKGQQGNLADIIYKITEEATARGETIKILGKDVSPATARRLLKGGLITYEVERDVLAFQVGMGIAGGVLGASAVGRGVLSTVSKIAKPLKYTTAPLGFGIGGMMGTQEFQRSGDIGDALAVGLGATVGFFGAVYSKEIITGIGRGGKAIGRFIFDEPLNAEGGRIFFMGVGGAKAKTKQVQVKKKAKGKKKQITKSEVDRFLKGKRVWDNKAQDFVWKEAPLSYNEKVEKARILMKAIKDPTNKEAVKEVLQVIRDNYGDDFLREWFTAEGVFSGTYDVGRVERPMVMGFQDVLPVTDTITRPSAIFGQPSQRMGMFGGLMFGGMFDTSQEVLSRTDQDRLNALRNIQNQRQLSQQESKQIQVLLSKQTSLTKQESRTAQATASAVFSMSKVAQDTQQVPKQIQKPRMAESTIFKRPAPGRPEPRRPTRPITPRLRPIGFWFPGDRKRKVFKKETRTGWIASYKKDATKRTKSKWVDLNTPKRPLSKGAALDRMGRYVDTNITARGKIRPIKQTKIVKGKKKKVVKVFPKPLPRGDDYFGLNRHKFREHQIRKGKKYTTPRQYIEKAPYRLDSPKERGQIQKAKRQSIGSLFGFSSQPQRRGRKRRSKTRSPFRL